VVFLTSEEVIRPSERSNHVSRSGEGIGSWIFSQSLKTAWQFYLLQLGQGLKVLLRAVSRMLRIAVWFDPVEGRLLDQV
jgi:hypothetical protein